MDANDLTTQIEAELLAKGGDLADMPGHLFRILESRSKALFLSATTAHGVTPRQFAVLYVLLQRGAMIQADLAEHTQTDKSTLGEMLKRMAERGLLVVETGEDKRSVIVSLTDVGRQIVMDVTPTVIRTQEALLDPLPEEYRLLFLKCLRILVDAEFKVADEG
ncbi:MAG: MarR family transcriptional regulator [Pseudomonadota bacterium]|nr:MarR family transcriptional regulator [Pseudomonadota bacterium]